MRFVQLRSAPDGTVESILRLASGEETEVTWTIDGSAGIPVAAPDPCVFDREPMDAAGVRAIVAAVIAFSRVSEYPMGARR